MKKKLINVLLIISSMVLFTGCGSSVYEKHNNNYVNETHVNGVVFDSPSSVIDQATAVTMITDDMESGTYLYKDGEATYLLFNSENIVIMAQKGTEFGFSDTSDYKEALTSHGLNQIWFDEIDKSLNYKTSSKGNKFKIVMDVKADVSITSDVYGIFAGKLAVLTINDDEYSIFAGVPGESMETVTKNQLSIINHVVASLDKNESYTTDAEEDSEVKAESEKIEDEVEPVPVPENEKSTEDNVDIEPVEQSEDTAEDNSSELESESAEEKTIEESAEDDKEESVTDDTTESVEVELEEVTEPDTNKEEDKVATEEKPTNKTDKKKVVFSNQKNKKESASSLYNMKTIGDSTTIAAETYGPDNYKLGTVTLNALQTGDEATAILKKALGKKYKEADAGMSWHVVEYSSSLSTEDAYIDIRMEGLDGGKLVSKGIAYSKKTNDILKYVTGEKSSYSKYYCYYQVPNGCKEYLLEMGMFGDNSDEARKLNAYFKITI